MKIYRLILIVFFCITQGCANYTTPAAGVNITAIGDEDIAELMAREPQANFPARIAVARLQSSQYSSNTNHAYGKGVYSVVTTRDVESEESFTEMSSWSGVHSIAPVGRLFLPEDLESLKDIRLAAARLKADLVLVYTIDTAFHTEDRSYPPLALISLGLFSKTKAHVSSTTSGAILDVRTGFVYGVAEATEKEQQSATVWSTEQIVDRARLNSEAKSFVSFMQEARKLWSNILTEHG